MKQIILNSTNIVANGSNNTFRYAFPNGGVTFKDTKVALTSLSMYYSWDNVTNLNNKLSYQWIDGTLVVADLPPGYYTIEQMNAYLQSVMIAQNHYLKNAQGDNVFYLEVQANSVFYSIQVNAFPLPTSLPTGWTKPGPWALPATPTTPQLILGSLSSLWGIPAQTYPPTPQATPFSVQSSTTPNMTPIQSLVMTCSLVNQTFSIPCTLFYSFSPDVQFGSLIRVQPPSPVLLEVQNGQFNDVTITFLDQNLNPVAIKDSNTVILLQFT